MDCSVSCVVLKLLLVGKCNLIMGKKNSQGLGKSIIKQRAKSSGNIKHANNWVSHRVTILEPTKCSPPHGLISLAYIPSMGNEKLWFVKSRLQRSNE